MKILLAGFGQYPVFAPAWVKALKYLGHDVLFFDFHMYFNSGLLGYFENLMLWKMNISKMNYTLYECAKKYRPDVTLVHNGNFINIKTIKLLRDISWVAGYQHDDPFGAFYKKPQFYNFRKTIPYYNSHHIIRELNFKNYEKLGVDKNISLLMTYYVPWLHYPLNNIKKDIDVAFVGHAEKDERLEYIKYLFDKGIKIKIFGPAKYWERYLPKKLIQYLGPINPVYGIEYIKTILRSKICLAFYSNANRDDYAYRVFEIPACNGFLMAKSTNLMQKLYQNGKEAVLFSSPSDLAEKINFYLTSDSERNIISNNGYLRVKNSGYDVISKMRQWVDETSCFMKNNN